MDSDLAYELKLYIDNDGQLYRQQTQPIYKNLCRRKKKGTYDYKKSVKLWKYLADNGAKKYHKEFRYSGKWHDTFNVPTREATAKELARDFRDNWKDYCER